MGWYITIQQEMRDLGLKGNELIVFAFLNGYSQEGQGCYFGSLAHLQGVCGIASRQTAIDTLKSLVAKGLVNKSESVVNGVKRVYYSVCPEFGHPVQKLDNPCPKIGHNNKDDIDININTLSIKERSSRFQKPSVDEVRSYCQERGNDVDPEQFCNFYESKGWFVGKSKMKDWRAAVRTWEKRDRGSATRRATAKESVLEHNLKVMDGMYGTNMYGQTYGK